MEEHSNSIYALKSRQEFRELMEVPGYYEYGIKVYDYLEIMEPGTVLVLKAPPERIEWLIKTVHLFIISGNHWMEYEFNADWTKVRRVRR